LEGKRKSNKEKTDPNLLKSHKNRPHSCLDNFSSISYYGFYWLAIARGDKASW